MKKYIKINGAIIDTKSAGIEQSNNIYELCETFVCEELNVVDNSLDCLCEIVESLGYAWEEMTIYGAVWTKKGLIYVAKLNNQCEFDLLKTEVN